MSALRAVPLACVLALPVAAAPLYGCGQSAVVGPGRVLRLALGEYRINPSSAQVSAGRLTVLVSNFGRLTHDFEITAGGRPLVHLKPLAPGATERATLHLAPGSYGIASTLSSDQALGILGTLTVS